jgi:CHASE2 domain-containing sensor protein
VSDTTFIAIKLRRRDAALWFPTLIVVAAALAVVIVWRTPGLEFAARDALLRARGPLPPAEDIAIVAFDEASLAQLGRFPWPRALTAEALDRIAAAQPKVISFAVLYGEPSAAPTGEADDRALAEALARADNVVLGAQLIENIDAEGQRRMVWLRPLPAFEQAAAGVGHVHVSKSR